MLDLFELRREYSGRELSDHPVVTDPIVLFNVWFNEAVESQCAEPNAMHVSTVDSHSRPHSRIVLLKSVDQGKFVFFSNYESAKGRDISMNQYVSLLFYWPELYRQIRIEGTINKTSISLSETYFNSRPLGSRISAVASPQSSIVPSRQWLEERWADTEKQSTELKRPDHWGGYEVTPERFEFWQGRENRLHDRLLFTFDQHEWSISRLAP